MCCAEVKCRDADQRVLGKRVTIFFFLSGGKRVTIYNSVERETKLVSNESEGEKTDTIYYKL
jgi:hypothetical protein